MDLIFVMPETVSDGVFKVYYDRSSGPIYQSECSFFTINSGIECEGVDKNKTKLLFKRLDIGFYYPCQKLEIILEFATMSVDTSNSKSAQEQVKPQFFLTNFKIISSFKSDLANETCPLGCEKNKCYKV
jgi:hypothetical protein